MSSSTATAPTISPLRMLIVTPAATSLSLPAAPSPITPLLTALTGTLPLPEQVLAGFAGYTTHAPLVLQTKYYNAFIGIWCDEVGTDWRDTFLDPGQDAREVRSAVGAICVALNSKALGDKVRLRVALDLVEQVEEVRVACEDEAEGREIVGAVVLVGDGGEEMVDQLEEGLRGERGVFGWDVVGWNGETVESSLEKGLGTSKNEYGEKSGIERVKEILEAVPWTTSSGDDEGGFESGTEADWTTSEQRELDREMMGLKMDLREEVENIEGENNGFGEDEWPELQGSSEDVKVEQLQGLMERLIATREAASELSGIEKQIFAKREVERIMKQMG